MKKIILLIVLGVVIVAGIISIFSGGRTEYGTKANVKVPKIEDAAKPPVKKVTFLIDNSGSMRGYVDFSGNKPGFQKAKKMLLSVTGDFMSNCSNNLHAETKAECNGNEYDTNGTTTSLSNYSAFSGPVTELTDLIKAGAVKARADSSVCIIVSDMVLSFGRKVLEDKKDKYYNAHSLSDLKTRLRDTFKGLKDQGKDVMIVKYEGHFNGGFYYNYTENIDPCEFKDTLMEKRPFYYTIIGTPKAIKSLCVSKCIPAGYTKIFTSLALDDADITTETYQVSQPSDQALWTLGCPDPKKEEEAAGRVYSLTQNKNLKEKASEFTFSFPRFELPVYVNDKLEAEYDNRYLSNVTPIRDNSSFSVTTCPFNKLDRKQTVEVKFTSPRYVDIESSSTPDDVKCKAKEMESRTWGFEAVGEALYDAYGIKEDTKNLVLSLEFRILK